MSMPNVTSSAALPPRFWAVRVGFFRRTSVNLQLESESLHVIVAGTSKCDVIPYGEVGDPTQEANYTLRLPLNKTVVKLRFASIESQQAFVGALKRRKSTLTGQASGRAFDTMKQSRSRGFHGAPTRVPVKLVVKSNSLEEFAEPGRLTRSHNLNGIVKIHTLLHEDDCFIVYYAHRSPQMYWAQNRTDLVRALTDAASALKHTIPLEHVQDLSGYREFLRENGMDDSMDNAAVTSLPGWVNVSVVVPCDHEKLTVASESKREDGESGESTPQPTFLPSRFKARRLLVLSATHLLELNDQGTRVLFSRPLTDVQTVCYDETSISIVFRTDGLVKRLSFVETVGYIPMANGGNRFVTSACTALGPVFATDPRQFTMDTVGVAMTAEAMADSVASAVVAAASVLGCPVDVLWTPLHENAAVNGRNAPADNALFTQLMKDIMACEGLVVTATGEPAPSQLASVETALAAFVATVPYFRQPKGYVKGTVAAVLRVVETCVKQASVVSQVAVVKQYLRVGLLAVAALRRLTHTKPGFDEACKTPAAFASVKTILNVTGSHPTPDTSASSNHWLRFIGGAVLRAVTVLDGPSKRNPGHGMGLLAVSSNSVPVYAFSKHERHNREVVLPAVGIPWLNSQWQTLCNDCVESDVYSGVLSRKPASLSCWIVLDTLEHVIRSQGESSTSSTVLQTLEALLVSPTAPKTQDAPVIQLPRAFAVLCDLCSTPHRGLAALASAIVEVVLRSVDGETKGKFQLKARDDGLLLHQLWLVVSQSTTAFAVPNDSRMVSFQLLQALIDGNSGLEHVVRRAFPPGLHPSSEFVVQYDEYGRTAGYVRTIGGLDPSPPSTKSSKSRQPTGTRKTITTATGSVVLVAGASSVPRTSSSSGVDSTAHTAGPTGNVLGFLEDSKSIQQPIERWSVIWNQETAKELKAGLAREVLKFEASKVASHSPSVDSLDALLSNRRIVWNAPDFEVVYPTLESEVMVGPYILRLVFPGAPGMCGDDVRPEKPLSPSATPELLSQLMYRLLGDDRHEVRLGCIRAMERVLATATSPPSPLHILGHTVHLVCVSNGVIASHVTDDDICPDTSRKDNATHALVAADILEVDLQFEMLKVWQACLTTPANVRRWWLAGGVSAVISVLQRTLGHVTERQRHALDDSHMSGLSDMDSMPGSPPPESKSDDVDPRPSGTKGTRKSKPFNDQSWLFTPTRPTPDSVAQRCLEVLYQVALIAAGDEGVGGGSGGRTSNASGQRSNKVYTPPARIFQTLASPQVVAVVALMLRARSPAVVETALSLLETALVWCRATANTSIQLARTGLFELLLQTETPDWTRPARILKALHLSQTPAHGMEPSAIHYLRRRMVAHGSARDLDEARDLQVTFPELVSSCVSHLLPDGLVVALKTSTAVRFAALFNTSDSVHTPEVRWSSNMRNRLVDGINEFIAANLKSVTLTAAQTPAASPALENWSWVKFGIVSFVWPQEEDHNSEWESKQDDTLQAKPWHGPTIVYSNLRKHLQCGGIFLSEFNKPVHALSWPLQHPAAFLALVTRRLHIATQECGLALKTVTLPHPNDEPSSPDALKASRDHSASILTVALLLRTEAALFQRCLLQTPQASPQHRRFLDASRSFDGLPTLTAALSVLVDGVMLRKQPNGAVGLLLPGPGGFAVVRAANAILACCQCSDTNVQEFAKSGGLRAVTDALGIVRTFEGVTPDPCVRHLDLAVTMIPGIVSETGSAVDSDSDSSMAEDDSELETSMEESSSPHRPAATRGKDPTASVVPGRQGLLVTCAKLTSLVAHVTSTRNNPELVLDIIQNTSGTDAQMPLVKDLLHYCVISAPITHVGASRSVRRGGDGGSVLSHTTTTSTPYDDQGLNASPRTEVVAAAALQALTELFLVHAPELTGNLCKHGSLWYLLWLVLQADPMSPSPLALAAMKCLRFALRSTKQIVDSTGVADAVTANTPQAMSELQSVVVGCMRVVHCAFPANIVAALLDTTASDGDAIKTLMEENLNVDVLWTPRVRRELYRRSQCRVASVEKAGPFPAVSLDTLPPGDVDTNGETRLPSASWGSEENGFTYDCLSDELRLSDGRYLRYYQDATHPSIGDAGALMWGLAGMASTEQKHVGIAVASGNEQSIEASLRHALIVMKALSQVSQRHSAVAELLTQPAPVLASLQVGVVAAEAVAKFDTSRAVINVGTNVVLVVLRHVVSLPHPGSYLPCLANPTIVAQLTRIMNALLADSLSFWDEPQCIQAGAMVLDMLMSVVTSSTTASSSSATSASPDALSHVVESKPIFDAVYHSGALIVLFNVALRPDVKSRRLKEDQKDVVMTNIRLLKMSLNVQAESQLLAVEATRFMPPSLVESFMSSETSMEAYLTLHNDTVLADSSQWNALARTQAVSKLSDEWSAWEVYCRATLDSSSPRSVPSLAWSPLNHIAPQLPVGFPNVARSIV